MIIFFLINTLVNFREPSAQKIDPRCFHRDYTKAWVYFTDKGINTDQYPEAIAKLSRMSDARSLQRRKLRGDAINYGDFPPYDDYIEEVIARGGHLLYRSKWLNAASFIVDAADLENIARLSFVYKIDVVARYQGNRYESRTTIDSTSFGLTYRQLDMFNVKRLHEWNVFGSSIRIGILDTGFRRTHSALKEVAVIAERDFLGGDQIFAENTPITVRGGLYTDMAFVGNGNSLHLFLIGDTLGMFGIHPSHELMHIHSSDGGVSWADRKVITSSYRSWKKELSVCGADTMFIFFRDQYGLKYMIFTDTVAVGATPLGSGTDPTGVAVNDSIYVFFANHGKLLMRKGGYSGFGAEAVIDSANARIKNPKAVVTTDKIGVFYDTYAVDSIFFIRSSMPETTFTRSFLTNGKKLRAVNNADTIYAVWLARNQAAHFDIVFARSDDFGASFLPSFYVAADLPSVGKFSIVKSGINVSIIWESQGRIYYRNSYDNGISFNPVASLTGEFLYLPTAGAGINSIIKFHCARGDSVTDDYAIEHPDHWHPHHGTEMLGVIGGYLQNYYIGVAPGAQFLVAKTENPDTTYEFPIEEDTWIAGLEWMESRGADIVNSSLGYTNWYQWPVDYDGNTSPASIAAQEAVKRGVVIVNSVGNVASPRIVVPADAPGVIAVGGIDTLFNRWEYSGYFPTADHSPKKPEIVCLSDAPVVVNPDSVNSYLYSRGTSAAAALISGICALLLEGHPNWTPDSVRNALMMTASHAHNPSDSLGYGWPDAFAAFNYSPSGIDTLPGPRFLPAYPNPFVPGRHNMVYLPFKLNASFSVEFRVFTIDGRLIKHEERPLLMPGRYEETDPNSQFAAFRWDGRDENGDPVGSGLYYCLLISRGGGNDIAKIAVIH